MLDDKVFGMKTHVRGAAIAAVALAVGLGACEKADGPDQTPPVRAP